ncbi:hypothetical protein EVAR_30763_1 [Eumeta japonica]|uniref:Uncharacterized protein n=1 Tax=Eumeta variegata TaxID=151549 RepID=A0A4C1V6R2_EUMVA|nr:hypothetical protein EVAR_30763_1 [Eumeta japonica]
MNERDIEDFFSQLEGSWLSEDGLDDQDSDDEKCNVDEIIRVFQEENNDDEDETADIDPLLVESQDQELPHTSSSFNLQSSSSFSFDRRSLIWKKGILCMTQIKLLSWGVLLLQVPFDGTQSICHACWHGIDSDIRNQHRSPSPAILPAVGASVNVPQFTPSC